VRRDWCTLPLLVMTEPPNVPTGFSSDPYEWFDRIRTELARGGWHETLDAVEPASWTGPHRHRWRVVRTQTGIEVRPELQEPFLRNGESPRVTAIAIGRDEIRVEMRAGIGRWVDRFGCDSFDVAAVGRSMLDERDLPHDNLPRLFPTTDP
jgi:hypothetical protein